MRRLGKEIKEYPTLATSVDVYSKKKEWPKNYLKLVTKDFRWWINEDDIVTCELNIKIEESGSSKYDWRLCDRYHLSEVLKPSLEFSHLLATSEQQSEREPQKRSGNRVARKATSRHESPLGVCPACQTVVWELSPIVEVPTSKKMARRN